MKLLTLLLIVNAACLCRLQWIKLSPIQKELAVTESVISVFTPFDQSFIQLSDAISDKNIKSNITHISISNYMELWQNDSTSHVYTNNTLDPNVSSEKINAIDNKMLKNFTSMIAYFHQFVNKIPGTIAERIALLKSIHDSMLISIDDRLSTLWPSKKKREARGYKEHHVDFPSAEMALMTIGFLTFAVYLIKFVLQIINIFKAKKTMMFAPMVTGAGRSFINDDIEHDKSIRIIQLMESFNSLAS